MRNPRLSPLAHITLVLLFCLTWSSAFSMGKLALSVCPPNLFLGLRFFIAGGLLLAWAVFRGEARQAPPRVWLGLALLGLINQAGYLGLVWNGMKFVSSGLAAVIASSNPIFVSAAALPFLAERMSKQRALGLAIGMAGVIFVLRNRIQVSGAEAGGIAMVNGGMFSFVAGTLIFKRWSPQVPLTLVVGIQSLSGGVVLMSLGLTLENIQDIQLVPVFWLTLAYNVLVISIGAFALWFTLLRMGSATSASSFHFLNPPLGLFLGWVVLGERVSLVDLLGIFPIALGILLVTVQGNPFKSASPVNAPAPHTTPSALSAETSSGE